MVAGSSALQQPYLGGIPLTRRTATFETEDDVLGMSQTSLGGVPAASGAENHIFAGAHANSVSGNAHSASTGALTAARRASSWGQGDNREFTEIISVTSVEHIGGLSEHVLNVGAGGVQSEGGRMVLPIRDPLEDVGGLGRGHRHRGHGQGLSSSSSSSSNALVMMGGGNRELPATPKKGVKKVLTPIPPERAHAGGDIYGAPCYDDDSSTIASGIGSASEEWHRGSMLDEGDDHEGEVVDDERGGIEDEEDEDERRGLLLKPLEMVDHALALQTRLEQTNDSLCMASSFLLLSFRCTTLTRCFAFISLPLSLSNLFFTPTLQSRDIQPYTYTRTTLSHTVSFFSIYLSCSPSRLCCPFPEFPFTFKHMHYPDSFSISSHSLFCLRPLG
ncbi:hypothetical protein BJ165DRAFT_571038 [Panaeolus papilionaceus]|nr:hypothetical protein BJ165DRAFT_571038 [Panaeolus papilionaceus]